MLARSNRALKEKFGILVWLFSPMGSSLSGFLIFFPFFRHEFPLLEVSNLCRDIEFQLSHFVLFRIVFPYELAVFMKSEFIVRCRSPTSSGGLGPLSSCLLAVLVIVLAV